MPVHPDPARQGDSPGTPEPDASPAGKLIELPIFPLGTVLFPGGVLPLRIFETRYMDMARECIGGERPFGVCLITSGNEVGEAAEHEAIGCTARIIDWDMAQLGVLQVKVLGGQRFRTLDRRVAPDGLIRASVELLAADLELPLPDELAACAKLVKRLIQDLVERESDTMKRMIEPPYRLDSAAWVGNRLCEFLPIPSQARHRLMALDDPVARLAIIHQHLRQQGVL